MDFRGTLDGVSLTHYICVVHFTGERHGIHVGHGQAERDSGTAQ